MDDEEYARLCAEALAKSASRAVPRPLPKQPERKPRSPKYFDHFTSEDGSVEHSAARIASREGIRTFAVLREDEATSEARARPKTQTRSVDVESPYGRSTNGFDRVERVIDTIDWMLRKRMIGREQEAAARMVQDAWAAAPGAIRCALSAGEGGQGPGSRSITSQQEWAGGILNDVRKELGRLDSLVVVRICGIGMSIEQTARMVFAVPESEPVKQHQTLHVGMRLRMALAMLAKVWGIRSPRPKIGVLKGEGIGVLSVNERAAKDVERVVAPRGKRGRKLRRSVHRPKNGA